MSSMRFTLNSLRARLILLVALALAPTAVMTIINGFQEREHAIAVAEENLQRLTNLAAANEAQSLEGARQILQDMASVPDLLGDPQRCHALLANILNRNAGYTNFGVIQLNGDVSCSAVETGHIVNLGDREHFKRAIRERRFVAGNYVFGRVIQKHTINLTYPVTNADNTVVAVVFAALDLTDLDKFVKDVQLAHNSLLLTADAEGSIISRRPAPQDWFGKKVSEPMHQAMTQEPGLPVVLEGPDGVERLHTFARVGLMGISDYTVTIGIPRDGIIAPARRDLWRNLISLAATTALAMLAAWFVGDVLIVRRVRRLADTADRIASGSLATRTGMAGDGEEISQLARALDDMAEALQTKEAEHLRAEQRLRAADKRKDEFLAMLAHELRNPLAPISTGAQLLRMGQTDQAGLQRTAAIISRQVEHMTRLIDDLLDVSRVTRGLVTLSKEALDLNLIVADAVEQMQPVIDARRHTLRLLLAPAPAGLYGDRKRLVQVIANLLNNAAKYTPEGGQLRLSVTLADDGQHLQLSVADNGIGMAPELVARVFELFAQAERTPDRSQGGLGLGLALVKTLAELHGGSVTAFSKGPGQGSTFTLRLPAHAVEPDPAPALESALADGAPGLVLVRPPRLQRLRFLLVDDNVDAVNTLQQFLTAAGHEVVVAYRAADAVALARTVAPQLCLLDIGLPDFDGNELARRLRGMPETAGAILIAVTGYGRREDKEKSDLAGFDHYFVKPLDPRELLKLINRLQPELARMAQR